MTKNFKLEEFTRSQIASQNRIDNTPSVEVMNNLRRSAEKMQSIRDFVGVSINITSGYRCPKLNSHPDVNGATNSDHLTGLGVDFRVSNYTFEEHKQLMNLLKKRPDVRYVKLYPANRLHVSFI